MLVDSLPGEVKETLAAPGCHREPRGELLRPHLALAAALPLPLDVPRSPALALDEPLQLPPPLITSQRQLLPPVRAERQAVAGGGAVVTSNLSEKVRRSQTLADCL